MLLLPKVLEVFEFILSAVRSGRVVVLEVGLMELEEGWVVAVMGSGFIEVSVELEGQ